MTLECSRQQANRVMDEPLSHRSCHCLMPRAQRGGTVRQLCKPGDARCRVGRGNLTAERDSQKAA